MFPLQSSLANHLRSYQSQKVARSNLAHLYSMDDRSLSDIGVTRGELAFKARKQPSPAKLRAKARKAEQASQKAAIKELKSLTDAELHDLGINRGNIAEVVRYGREGEQRQQVEQPVAANVSRKTTRGERIRAVKTLRAMDDAQLEDIGIIRGDIEDLVRNGRKEARRESLPGKLAHGLFSVFKGPVFVDNVAVAANTDSTPDKPPRNPVAA